MHPPRCPSWPQPPAASAKVLILARLARTLYGTKAGRWRCDVGMRPQASCVISGWRFPTRCCTISAVDAKPARNSKPLPGCPEISAACRAPSVIATLVALSWLERLAAVLPVLGVYWRDGPCNCPSSTNSTPTQRRLRSVQLIGRHFGITLTEGGFIYSALAAGPFRGLVNATATAYPSLFNVSVNYLFGRSDLPAALQQ
jgi:hypothetical protein